ncbi:MAG: hypothetical protein FJ215_02465 [Ignavibacteria bacterium]|nr:hypothetical protein [Ignavibacteria bacterium]
MIDLRWLPSHFFRNLVSLHGAQAVGYLLPLVTIPYIVRIIGPENYGSIAIATAIVQYFVILSEYGYNFTGPRDVACSRDDRPKLNRYVNALFWTRASLALVSILSGGVLLTVLPLSPDFVILVCLASGILLGKVLLLHPVFYGLELARNLVGFTTAGGLVGLFLILALIQQPGDYVLIPLIYSAVSVVIGCVSLVWMLAKEGLRIRKPDVNDVKTELQSGFRVFVSTQMIGIYVVGNTLILGMFASSTIVGWYAAGEKLVRMAQGLFLPLQNLIMPTISRDATTNRHSALNKLNRAAVMVAPFGLAVSLLIVLLSRPIAQILFGAEFSGTIEVLRILGAIPLIMSMTFLYSDTFLIGFGYQKYWSTMIMVAGLSSIFITLVLVGILDMRHIGSSLALLMTELLVLSGALWKYREEAKSVIGISQTQT